mgnify:CR=1 FL=1
MSIAIISPGRDVSSWVKTFESMNDSIGNLPFLYSADAEPSLVNRKIEGSKPVKKANELVSIFSAGIKTIKEKIT